MEQVYRTVLLASQLAVGAGVLALLEDGQGQGQFVCETGVRVDDEKTCHDSADQTTHERKDHEDFLDCPCVVDLRWILHDVESSIGRGIGHSEGIKNGREIDGVQCILGQILKRPDGIITLYIDLIEIQVQLRPHIRTEDDIGPILEVVGLVLGLGRIDDAVHVVIGEVVPLAVIDEELGDGLGGAAWTEGIGVVAAGQESDRVLMVELGGVPALQLDDSPNGGTQPVPHS